MTESEILMQAGIALQSGAKLLPATDDGRQIAMDAAMQTTANVNLPELFATYVSPEVIDILTAPRNSTEIFSANKKAEWKDQKTMFPVAEFIGKTTGYSDYGRGPVSDANLEFASRDVYRFQTMITCGDLEQERAAAAKVNLLSRKQKAAARVIDIDSNAFNLYGVSGLSIYGLLNDPNLPSALSPSTEGSGDAAVTAWTKKSAVGIYNDVLKMINKAIALSGGGIRFDSKMVLALPPDMMGYIAQITTLGVAPILENLKKYFTNLRFVTLPELKDSTGVCKAMLVIEEIEGEKTGEFGFADRLRQSRVVLEHTSMSQKWMSSTTGCLLYRPFAVITMSGIES